jgi:hypothetical protein
MAAVVTVIAKKIYLLVVVSTATNKAFTTMPQNPEQSAISLLVEREGIQSPPLPRLTMVVGGSCITSSHDGRRHDCYGVGCTYSCSFCFCAFVAATTAMTGARATTL